MVNNDQPFNAVPGHNCCLL